MPASSWLKLEGYHSLSCSGIIGGGGGSIRLDTEAKGSTRFRIRTEDTKISKAKPEGFIVSEVF